jgi:hypothetical protein
MVAMNSLPQRTLRQRRDPVKPTFRRNHLRTYRQVRIRWSGVEGRRAPALTATTVNTSREGMCFEALQKIEPGTEIAISLDPETADGRARLDTEPIRAKVCWCNDAGSACFDIGVQYLAGEKGNA